MINQAKAAGLQTSTAMINHLVLGKARRDSSRVYAPPSSTAKLHTSLKGLWWLLEAIPKLAKWREWPKRRSLLGLYLPLAEPRPIPEGAHIHRSVFERMCAVPEYRPPNLPSKRIRVG